MNGREDNSENITPGVNPDYASFQIAKASITNETHPDLAVRLKAAEKVRKWKTVLQNILEGRVKYGSRTPIAGIPGWATLEVVTGGFATNGLLAGGPIQDHERELLQTLPPGPGKTDRQRLNAYFLSEPGLAELTGRLQSGCYEINVPEEGALLTVAWLVTNGHADEAGTLLLAIAPFFEQLRFYPLPSTHPKTYGSRVHLQDVAASIHALQNIKPNQKILTQKEAVEVWAPFYDRLVALFLETVEDDWPCRKYPPDWSERSKALTKEYAELRKRHTACGKPGRAQGHFAQLREFLARCADQPQSLTGLEVGRIRLILRRYAEKRGRPDSLACTEARARQQQEVAAPTFHRIAQVVIPRLEKFEQKSGLDDLSPVETPISPEESIRFTVPAGTTVPGSIQRKVERCLNETIQELVKRDLITSGDVLARVLPQMTAEVRATAIFDPALRQLYAGVYRAFRRRRSLLLLNLEKQIQLEELPWVKAIDRVNQEKISSTALTRQAFEEISVLAITSFPHAIIPNKLLQELRALAKGMSLHIPLVEEVAVDIFMGEFSDKFVAAAKQASRFLRGSLYSTYYGVEHETIEGLPDATKQLKKAQLWTRVPKANAFAQLCAARAGVDLGTWNPATNGMIVEQQQILTTQNLAALFHALDLSTTIRNQLPDLARECFRWICQRQQMKTDRWHAKLVMVKNTAYAWRQMIFFLSLLSPGELAAFLQWARSHFAQQSEDFRNRFSPALKGLIHAADGRAFDGKFAQGSGTRCFLGWTKETHWLLANVDQSH